MKVLLMNPYQDFDPEQALPWNAEDLVSDLELEPIFNAMAAGDAFLYQIARTALLSSLQDPDIIRYRQDVLRDCLDHPDVIQAIYQLPIEAIKRKRQSWMGIFSRYPSGILGSAAEMMRMFLDLLWRLRHIADAQAAQFHSAGFKTFFTRVQQTLDDAFFQDAEEHLKQLKSNSGTLLTVTLGRGAEAAGYQLRRPDAGQNRFKQLFSNRMKSCSFRLPPRDNAGARILGEIRDRGVNQVANALAQSADHVDEFFGTLRNELAFYLGAMNLHDRLMQLGEPTTFPIPLPAPQRQLTTTELYDVSLVLTTGRKVVGNDVRAQGKNLIIVTGANQGGKSTFLRSVGQAQIMLQSGLFAPARAFSANVCTGLFTHYRREEDASMTSGKLEEEMRRMSDIVAHLQPHALVLFNESFAATNEREGSEIARQVVRALQDTDVKTLFVTHLYAFAQQCRSANGTDALFLRAERRKDGKRTFRMIEAPPLQTSFGQDLYRQIFGGDDVP